MATADHSHGFDLPAELDFNTIEQARPTALPPEAIDRIPWPRHPDHYRLLTS